MWKAEETVLKRRAAVERWKANNREYYLQQKRDLSARPSYRARMRARYHKQQAELREAGILPRKLGRPRLYDGEEALEMKRQRAREASARYRTRQLLSQVEETDESEEIDSTTSENSP
jgi:hypothetical protein